MDPLQLMFLPGGRVSRLPYFLASITLGIAFVLLGGGLFFFMLTAGFAGMGGMTIGAGLLLLALVIGGFYSSVVLMTKRLHDMGHTGWHALWIMLAAMTPSVVSPPGEVSAVGALGSLVYLGAGIWLLFKRGEPFSNQYGPVPA